MISIKTRNMESQVISLPREILTLTGLSCNLKQKVHDKSHLFVIVFIKPNAIHRGTAVKLKIPSLLPASRISLSTGVPNLHALYN